MAIASLLVGIAINGAEVPGIQAMAGASGPGACTIDAPSRAALAAAGHPLPAVLAPPAATCTLRSDLLQLQIVLPPEALPRRALLRGPSANLHSAWGSDAGLGGDPASAPSPQQRVVPSLQIDLATASQGGLSVPRAALGSARLAAEYLPEPGFFSLRALPGFGHWGVLRLGPTAGRLAPGTRDRRIAQTTLRLPWSPSGVFPQQGLGVAEVILLEPTRLRLPGSTGSTLLNPGVYDIEARGLDDGRGLLSLEAEDLLGQRSTLQVPVRAGARQMPVGKTALEFTHTGSALPQPTAQGLRGAGLTIDHGWRPGITLGAHLAQRPSAFVSTGGNPQAGLALGEQSRLEGLWRLGRTAQLRAGLETASLDLSASTTLGHGLAVFGSYRASGPRNDPGLAPIGFTQLGLRQSLGAGLSLSLQAFQSGSQSLVSIGLLWQPRGGRGLTQVSLESLGHGSSSGHGSSAHESRLRLTHHQPLPGLGPLQSNRIDLSTATGAGGSGLLAQSQLPWASLQVAAQDRAGQSSLDAQAHSRLWLSTSAAALRPAIPSGLVVHRFGEAGASPASAPQRVDLVPGLPPIEDPPLPMQWSPEFEGLPEQLEWVGPPPRALLHADQITVLDHGPRLQSPLQVALSAPMLPAGDRVAEVRNAQGQPVPNLRNGMLHLGRNPQAHERLTVVYRSGRVRECGLSPPSHGPAMPTWLCMP